MVAIFAALAIAVAAPASALQPDHVTDDEMALLPPYCPDVYGFKYGDAYYNTSPNAPKWVALMGKGFWALHHYCWALINLSRIEKPWVSPMIKEQTREGALSDMFYVIDHTPPDFILLPEIYTKIGETQLALKRPRDANASYAKARSLKPDYWPPYFQWATYLQTIGQKGKAREIAELGLSYSPDAKPLRQLVVDLGGDPSAVVPRKVEPTSSAKN